MLISEFEIEFKKFVKIQGTKFDDDKQEFMRWCYKRLKHIKFETVIEILETACGLSDYFPKIGDINKAVTLVMAKGKSANVDHEKSNFDWIMSLNSSEASYYSHKLNDYQKKLLMEKISKQGFTKFEDINTAPWWDKYHEAMKLLSNSFMAKTHGEITRSEVYDSDL
jgi:hypothetical protein